MDLVTTRNERLSVGNADKYTWDVDVDDDEVIYYSLFSSSSSLKPKCIIIDRRLRDASYWCTIAKQRKLSPASQTANTKCMKKCELKITSALFLFIFFEFCVRMSCHEFHDILFVCYFRCGQWTTSIIGAPNENKFSVEMAADAQRPTEKKSQQKKYDV